MIAPTKQKKPPAKKAKNLYVVIWVLMGIFLLAILCYVCSSVNNCDKNIAETSHKTKINLKADTQKEVVTSGRIADELSPNKPEIMSVAWQKYYDGRDTNKWKVVYNPITKKEYLSRIVKAGLKNAPPPLYKSHSLNLLDAIVFKPIVSPMANVRIDERFMKNLQDGLIEKIVIAPEDSEEIAVRKQNMIDLQGELKARLKGGEDIRQLISDTLSERNRVAGLKQMMKQERANMKKNGASQEEIDDFSAICNQKLSTLGATPLITKTLIEDHIENSD